MAAPRALPLSCLATLLALACIGCRQQPPMAIEAPVSPPEMALIGAVLLDGLGDYSFPVTSDHPEVQRWFNQGLALAYGLHSVWTARPAVLAFEVDRLVMVTANEVDLADLPNAPQGMRHLPAFGVMRAGTRRAANATGLRPRG